jgi:hypothetical protein
MNIQRPLLSEFGVQARCPFLVFDLAILRSDTPGNGKAAQPFKIVEQQKL